MGRDVVDAHAPAPGQHGEPPSVGRVVVLETNPGFGCHWYHPAVFVASHAAFLRAAAGLAALSEDATCAAAKRLGLEGEPGGRDAVWGLF